MRSSIELWLLPASLLVAALAVAQPAAPSSSESFDRAIELAQKGQAEAAARALLQLADERPTDPFADDALAEAALLYEQTLGQPQRAVELLERLVKTYPESRLQRRSQSRLERLRVGLQSGAEPLRAYQALQQELPKLLAREQVARLRALLVKYPDFSLRDDVAMQIGTALARAGQREEALAELTSLEARVQPPLRDRVRLTRGELLLSLGRIDEAATLDASDSFKQQVAAARLRRTLWRIAFAVLLALVASALFVLGRRGLMQLLREPPIESLFFVPVALLFSLAGLTENRLIRWATLLLALGGWIEVTLVAGLARLPARHRRAQRLGLTVGLLIAVIALFLVVVESLGLTGLVVETLRHGPER